MYPKFHNEKYITSSLLQLNLTCMKSKCQFPPENYNSHVYLVRIAHSWLLYITFHNMLFTFQVLQKRKYLCATDYDEKYFDWHCRPDGKPPSHGSYWYTACGVPLPNRVELVVIVSLICVVAATVFRNLHFRSQGDGVFTYKDGSTNVGNKIKQN